jgi:hypothetical protein
MVGVGLMNAFAWAVLLVMPLAADVSAAEEPTPAPTTAAEAPEAAAATPTTTLPCPWCVSYPIPLSEPDFLAPGRPFKLVDLRYHVSDTEQSAAQHEFDARFRVSDWGYLGTSFVGDRRTATFQAHRVDLSVSEENRNWDLLGAYRTRYVLFEAEAQRRDQPVSSTDGAGWLLTPTVSVRVQSDLELIASATGDTATPYDEFGRAASLGFLWQPSSKVDVNGSYETARVDNDTNYENTVHTGALASVLQIGPTELDLDGRVDDVNGRFPRTDVETGLGARIPFTPRLLVEGSARMRFETELRAHEYRGAVTWYARRFYLPHTGLAAERTFALARQATALGENERKSYDDENRRLQRERLSLSPHARELAGDMADLYHAQVEERSVPTLGVEYIDTEDTLPGTSSQTLHALVGVPWPPAPPWAGSETAVPFLRLDLTRERRVSGADVAALRYSAALTASLNREMDLVGSWSHADPTQLEIIRGIPPQTTLEFSFVYAFGR